MDALHRKILSLRYRGYDHEDIAHILEVTVDRVRKCIDRAAAYSADQERVAVVREAELAKIEEMEEIIFPFATTIATDPDSGKEYIPKQTIAAQNQVLKLMERRASILGSDKQAKEINSGGFTLVQILADMSNAPKNITPVMKAVEHVTED